MPVHPALAVSLVALLALPASAPALAQTDTSPGTIAYQGVLQQSGAPVPDGPYAIRISLFLTATGGSALYAEDHTVTTVGGVFAVSIGGGASTGENFEEVTFATPVWLETSVGGTALGPRTLLEAVPVARSLRAGARIQGAVLTGASLYVENTSTVGVTSGVAGVARSEIGWGVGGSSNDPNGSGIGVRGVSAGIGGSGVYGRASSTSGTTYGGYFESASNTGRAVYGEATATSGATTYGGYFLNAGNSGSAVYGRATSTTGQSNGVYGQTDSAFGVGVSGRATASGGESAALLGQNLSTTGHGALIIASSGTGSTTGIEVRSFSPDGVTARFQGPGGLPSTSAAQSNDDVVVNASDAVLGLYSDGGATWGSALALGEVNGSGGLVNKWGIVRRTGATGSLYFTFGTDVRYATNDAQMRIDTDGSVHADGSFIGGGADLAEFFPLDEGAVAAPGQVVGLRGGRVSLATDGAEQVAVISSDPAFVGNPDAAEGGALVALVGQVTVEVSGAVSTGDLLVASGAADGRARAVSPSAYVPTDGAVIGRVLSADGGRVVALVGVYEAAALRDVVQRQADRLDALAADRDRQQADLDALRAEVDAIRATHAPRAER